MTLSTNYPRSRREQFQQGDGPRHPDVGHERGDAPQRHEAPHQVHRTPDPGGKTREKPGENGLNLEPNLKTDKYKDKYKTVFI